MRSAAITALTLVCTITAAAQPDAVDVSDVLEEIRAKHDVPALAAIAIDDSGIVISGVSGVRKRGRDTPATLNDKWHLGSCTKAMTATLIAIFVERGELDWNTTITDVFTDIEMAGSDEATWSDATLELLCANQGGVPTDLSANGLWRKLWTHEGTPIEQRHDLLVGVTSAPPKTPPGTDYEYSNGGFAIAGHMAETVTGVQWEDLMRRELFEPLGMTGAGFGAPGTPAVEDGDPIDQPRGHTIFGVAVEPVRGSDNPPAIGPAGTVHMTLPDWAQFVKQHMLGEQPGALAETEAPQLVTPETMRDLHRPRGEAPYALGWLVATRPWAKGDAEGDAGRVIFHNGSNNMWFAVTWIAPERGFAVLVTCNQGGQNASRATDEAAGALIGKYRELTGG